MYVYTCKETVGDAYDTVYTVDILYTYIYIYIIYIQINSFHHHIHIHYIYIYISIRTIYASDSIPLVL